MSKNKKQFIIQIFNAPLKLTRDHLTLNRSLGDDWTFQGISAEKGQYVAKIALKTSYPISLEDLEREITVQSSIHNVSSDDIKVWLW